MKGIPIFLSADDNYAPFVATTIASICDNTKSFCDFYILEYGITEENKEKIGELKNKFNNFSLEFITIDIDKFFDKLPVTSTITKSMYSRWLIPGLKTSIDKAIYSDVDVIVLGDIAKMYNENLEDFALGAVWEECQEAEINQERKKRLNLSPEHKYFSSGNLLINCKKWREENIFDKLVALTVQYSFVVQCPDQDILNIYFNNNYKELSSAYCYINQNYKFYKKHENIIIRHYNGPDKPWHYSFEDLNFFKNKVELLEEFWNYAKITPFFKIIKTYKKFNHASEQKMKIREMLNIKMRKAKNLTPANKEKLMGLKDKYKGKRCFIVGGSPSLKMLDLTKLNDEYVFTVNWGFNLREQGLKHSTFHVMTDIATFNDDNVIDFLPKDFCDTYLIFSEIDFPKDKFNTIFFDFEYRYRGGTKEFETDASKPLAENRTIILIVMQLAYYMGFSELYIIGVDLDFKAIKGHAYQETQGEKERQEKFSVLYQNDMYDAIAKATKILEGLGRKVYNASKTGALNCMPRVDYDSLFNKEGK